MTSLCARNAGAPLSAASRATQTLPRDTDRLGVVRTCGLPALYEREDFLPFHGRALHLTSGCLVGVGSQRDQVEPHRTLVGVVTHEQGVPGLDPVSRVREIGDPERAAVTRGPVLQVVRREALDRVE